MNPIRVIALVLIIGGVLGLVYGGFSYTKEDHEAKIGPIDITVQERKTIDVPIWLGVGAIVVGGILFLKPRI